MINLKSILIGNERVIGLQIKLPFTFLIFIFNTKGFLCGNTMNIENLNNQACICIMKHALSFDQCLTSEVLACNQSAMNKGIIVGMKGKEALMKMYED